MFFHKGVIDERVRSSVGYWASIWLGVTQILLAAVIFYRLYVINQPDAEIRDLQIVLAISIFGFIGIQLFIGGMMPVPTWKGALLMYGVLFSAVAVVAMSVHGVPELSEWSTTLLPGVLGPGIFVGLYWFIAYSGQRRLDRLANFD